MLGENREKVTAPLAATAGNRVNPKSAPKLSTSAPLLVASRVAERHCTISHCIQRASAAFASRIARSTEPILRSTRLAAAPCTDAAIFASSVEKFCIESCIAAHTVKLREEVVPLAASA